MHTVLKVLVLLSSFYCYGAGAVSDHFFSAYFSDPESHELINVPIKSKIIETTHKSLTDSYGRFLRIRVDSFPNAFSNQKHIELYFSEDLTTDYISLIERFIDSDENQQEQHLGKHLSYNGFYGKRYLYFKIIRKDEELYLGVAYSAELNSWETIYFDKAQSRDLISLLLELN